MELSRIHFSHFNLLTSKNERKMLFFFIKFNFLLEFKRQTVVSRANLFRRIQLLYMLKVEPVNAHMNQKICQNFLEGKEIV